MQDYIKLKQQLEILWQEVERMERENPEPGPGGTSDYTELTNKPSINGVELNGNKTLTQLGIAPAATTYTKTEVDGEIIGAITDLDVSSTAATGHYIKSIAQEDGLIVPVAETLATSPVPSSEKPITSGGVAAALANKADKSTTYTKDEVDTALSGKEDKITTVSANGTMTNSTTITDTGVSVDIPSDGGYWQISGCITWKGSPPTEAQLRVKFGTRTSDYLIARATSANDDNKNFIYLPVSCTLKADAYYPSDADKTIHVNIWGKTAAASGNCEVCLIARKIASGTATRGLSKSVSDNWDEEANEWNWLKDER